MNRIAALNTFKTISLALLASVTFNLMLFYAPKVLLALGLAGMLIAGVMMIYDVELNRVRMNDRLRDLK